MNPADANRAIAAVNPGSFSSNPPAFISDAGLARRDRRDARAAIGFAARRGRDGEPAPVLRPGSPADRDGNLWYASLTARPQELHRDQQGRGGDDRLPVRERRNPAPYRRASGQADDHDRQLAAEPEVRPPLRDVIENSGKSQNVVISECDTRPGGAPDPGSLRHAGQLDPGSVAARGHGRVGRLHISSVAAAPNGDVYGRGGTQAGPGRQRGRDRQLSGDRRLPCPGSWGPDTTVDDLEQKGKSGIRSSADPDRAGWPGGPPAVCRRRAGWPVYVAYSDLRHNGKRLCTATKRDRTFDSFIAAGPNPSACPVANAGVRLSDDGPLDHNQHFFPTLAVDPTTGEVQSSFHGEGGRGRRTARRRAESALRTAGAQIKMEAMAVIMVIRYQETKKSGCQDAGVRLTEQKIPTLRYVHSNIRQWIGGRWK